MFELRPFQQDLKSNIITSWQSGNNATIGVAPTGAGKTVIMSSIAADSQDPVCIIAHRKELIQQMSLTLAKNGQYHDIIAPNATISSIIREHINELGKSYYDKNSKINVSSVDTLKSRQGDLVQWASLIKLWMIDECHHVLKNNKWGKTISMFKNAKGVGFTASPVRCDRKSLHVSQGGVFDDLCVGPSIAELIELGFLCNYKIYGPPQSINSDNLKIGSTGDYTRNSLIQATDESTITGDVIQHYLKFANGKSGITFTVSIDSASKIAKAFNEAGVPAQAVSSKTPDGMRNEIISKFRRGLLKQLVNVDLFGEGFDVPRVEVVSMARPTESFGVYIQQFGRMLRTLEGKQHGILIDHVGNVKKHRLPDNIKNWTLLNEERGRRSTAMVNEIPIKTCTECFIVYDGLLSLCPHCGHKPVPESRSEPKYVDGDLAEFSPELLSKLRGETIKLDSEPKLLPSHLRGGPVETQHNIRHKLKLEAQKQLRETISYWAGIRKDKHGRTDSQIHKEFYFIFNIDILSAQGLLKKEAIELTDRIKERYWK